MRTKKHWMLNYLRYHDSAKRKEIIRACGMSAADTTNHDMQEFINQEKLMVDEDGKVRITIEGLTLHDITRAGLYRGVR